MSVTFSKQSNSSSQCDDRQNSKSLNHPIGEYSYCRHCGDSAGFLSTAPVYPYMPGQPLRCRICGNLEYDLSYFCLFRSACNSFAAPMFATKGEAYRYRDIFGATEAAGYKIIKGTFYFNEVEQKGRQEMLAELVESRVIYDRLIAALPENPSIDDLQTIAIELGLHRYPLPIFDGRLSRRAS